MIRIPLTVQSIPEAQNVRAAVLHHLGDTVYDRCPEGYEDVEVPEPIASCRVLGTPAKARGSRLSNVLTFRNGRSFAMLHFHYDPEDENPISYSLGSHAGWHEGGTEEHLRQHHHALDTLLENLGVLHESYRFTCPCGHEGIVHGGYADVGTHISKHNEEDHPERRISTMTLVNRDVIPNTPAHAETTQRAIS